MTVADQLARARDGSVRTLARLLSQVEDGDGEDVLAAAAAYPRHAHIIGLTGAPGVGKSTITSRLVACFRGDGARVAVLAVDPSSPFSGGALLGDRVRMGEHALDPGVFVRSMATRGHLGGLAAAARSAIRVLDAAGFDIVLVETVGVGQSEVEIAAAADSTVVLVAPGMGDGIQAAKAGILEIADVLVVNKADRDGARAAVRELRASVRRSGGGDWEPPVLTTVAATGEGVPDLVEALRQHRLFRVNVAGLHS